MVDNNGVAIRQEGSMESPPTLTADILVGSNPFLLKL